MNDISNRLLFDGYKSLNSKIDDAHYQIDFILKELEKIMTTVMDNSSRLDRRIDQVHDRIDDVCDECEECQETSDLSQEIEKRIEAILCLCESHGVNLGQYKAVLDGMYKSYREMNG